MVSQTAVETKGLEWAQRNPVGTGPFEYVKLVIEETLEYKRFDGYWQEGKP